MKNLEEIKEEIFKKFVSFSLGTRVMMLINRGIQNTNKGSKRWINKLISHDTSQFKKNLSTLIDLQYELNNPDIRLYSCVNSRDFDKAIRYMQHKQLDLINEEEKYSFYSRLHDNFCSALMKPENKFQRKFLIDLDHEDTDDLMITLSKNKVYGVNKYKSKKGWHVVTDPFNPVIIQDVQHCEIKKDALILLHYLEEKEQCEHVFNYKHAASRQCIHCKYAEVEFKFEG